jgi:small subunit ribosomal protein S21
MLKIEVNKGGIERALKNYKSKVIRTKQLKKLRDRKQFTKPSETRRKQIAKAKYVQSKKDSNE